MRNATFFSTFLITAVAFAQHANIWHFGLQAGLDFNSGVPIPLNESSMTAAEGCASICDDNGQLLFYTNGGRVLSSSTFRDGRIWDRNHDVMPLGDLEQNGGCSSSKQGVLIVEDPADDQQYYVFTVDCYEHNFEGGLRYFKVDMTANGGMGNVSLLDTALLEPPLMADVVESVIGIRHANGVDVWVLVHDFASSYHAFLVTASGISGPITTDIGPTIGAAGQLTSNLSSTQVCYKIGSAGLSLMDFDPATGILSNHLLIPRNAGACAFSPSGQYLYAAESIGDHRVFQYDLLASDIAASEQMIFTGGTQSQPILQLGPDGKIYMARVGQYYLGVIHSPDLPDTLANFQEEGCFTGGGIHYCAGGLPGFVNDLLLPSTTGISSPTAPEVTLHCVVSGSDLTIQTSANTGQARFTVFSSDGSLVHEEGPSIGTVTIPIAGYAAGLYVVRAVTQDHRVGSASFVLAR